MKGRLLSHEDGVTRTFHFDEMAKKSTIQVHQDVSGYLRQNTRAYNDSTDSNWKGDLHKIASIPVVVVEQWWKELGSDPFSEQNRAWLTARLNNRDFYKLRTKTGRV